MKGDRDLATIRNGNQSALVVIDLQNGVVANAWEREGVISRTAGLVTKARDERVPVVFVQHEDEELAHGSDAWRLVPELAPRDDEPVIAKRHQDAFEDTALEETLAGLGVSHLVIAGAQTDACIRFTTHRALAEGYDMTLVGDCHTTDDLQWGDVDVKASDVIAHTNLVFRFASYPGRVAGVASHDTISFTTPVGLKETPAR
jgi:nicotinamidase-related amidase